MSAGIDYGLGTTNINKETGIRYGVISQHSIDPEALSSIENEYGDPTCPKCGAPAHNTKNEGEVQPNLDGMTQYDNRGCEDYYCANCNITIDSQDCFPEEPVGMSYEQDGYRIIDCLDSDLMVIASPFYTYANFCSPCVPGAGNLDSPNDPFGAQTYCLGHDWFEGEIAPYPVFRVEDNKRVVAERQYLACENCGGKGRDTFARLAKVRDCTSADVWLWWKENPVYLDGVDESSGIYEQYTFKCFRCNGLGTIPTIVEIIVEHNK